MSSGFDLNGKKKWPLLPCPFCNSRARFATHYGACETDFKVVCTKCWCETPRCMDFRMAWEMWNRREGMDYVDNHT